ncbi:hypothetical protein VTL71DRAFT_2146 [Oculimacula yallundae]|uniref:Uncharacterized protein n=1 Tax=Oculimacula yallundae TaxID=86028 RepID=A0ABR4C819_9HELO
MTTRSVPCKLSNATNAMPKYNDRRRNRKQHPPHRPHFSTLSKKKYQSEEQLSPHPRNYKQMYHDPCTRSIPQTQSRLQCIISPIVLQPYVCVPV